MPPTWIGSPPALRETNELHIQNGEVDCLRGLLDWYDYRTLLFDGTTIRFTGRLADAQTQPR